MDIIKLVSIKNFCKQLGISRATFYRKAHNGEFELYKIPCSKRFWLISQEDNRLLINESNILEYLGQENEKMSRLLSTIT